MDHLLSDFAAATTSGAPMPYITGDRPGAFWMSRFRNIRGEKRQARGFQCNVLVFNDDWERGSRTPGIGVGLKNQLRQTGDWHVLIGALCEMLPSMSNRVSLDPAVRDAWGSPVSRMGVTFGPNELAMSKAAGDDMVEMMKTMGYQGVVHLGGGQAIPGSQIHEIGGAVMGRDKRTSVLDARNRSHDIPNLFATDGAAMSSSAQSNPSIIYIAFTARVAAFAAGELTAGRP